MDLRTFYEGKNIFLTGGTGFVGTAIIEKLLTTITHVGNIYVLVRPKKGVDAISRLNNLRYSKVSEFDKSKLIAIPGDVGEIDLGLSAEDKATLCENVNIVLHAAATLDFEASLKTAVKINLMGTKRVLEISRDMAHLEALVHVSSAYVNSNRKYAQEVLYPTHIDASKLIDITETLSDDATEEILPNVLGDHPNIYTLTKALAEHVVMENAVIFPCAIVRPSMIIGAWKDPAPGWTISKNGPQGFIMGAARGVIRRLPVDKNLVYDYIPVDIVVNNILAGAWHVATKRSIEPAIFQCTTSVSNPFKWSLVESLLPTVLHEYPLEAAVWYPTLILVPSLFIFHISAFIFHMIPAILFDAFSLMTGQRPMLVKLHRNVNRSLGRLAPFIFTEFKFDNKCCLQLHRSMIPADQNLFGLDLKDMVWKELFLDLASGVRAYLNNEGLDTLGSARQKDFTLYQINLIVQSGVVILLWFMFSLLLDLTMLYAAWVLPIILIFGYYL